jgi:TolB-like protein/DNA-binding SARP family transcriptional activator
MICLHLKLLGGFEARTASGDLIELPNKKAQALLAYLALHPDAPQTREKIAGLLWGDKDRSAALANLRQTLSGLRKAMPEACEPALSLDSDSLTAYGAPLDVDVHSFIEFDDRSPADVVDEATALYCGELLDGVMVKEAGYEEWLREARDDLHQRAVRLFSGALEQYEQDGGGDQAVTVAKRLLSLEPYDETTHRALMRLYAQSGRHGLALAQYKACRELLQADLDVTPEPATEALHEALLLGRRTGTSTGELKAATAPPSRQRLILIATGIVVALVAAGAYLWSAREEMPAETADTLAIPAGPTVAVLPFTNMSGDPAQAYFADGMTEEIITALSHFDLLVLARHTTAQFKDEAFDIREIRESLGAHYVVEGSVRKDEQTVRVTAQLIDTATGGHLWAQNFDQALSGRGVLSIQDEITSQVVGAIADSHGTIFRAVLSQSKAKRPESFDAYDCVLRAIELQTVLDAQMHLDVRACLERTVESEPDYADAWAWLSVVYDNEINAGLNPLPGSLDRAIAAGRRAVVLDPQNQIAHYAMAWAHYLAHDLAAFHDSAEKAIIANPNNAFVLSDLALPLAWSGESERPVAMFEKAVRLNPFHPGVYYFLPYHIHARAGDYEKAVAVAEKLGVPDFFWMHGKLAQAYAHLCRQEKAQLSAARLVALYPDFEENAWAELEALYWPDPDYIASYAEGLRKAGLSIPDRPD